MLTPIEILAVAVAIIAVLSVAALYRAWRTWQLLLMAGKLMEMSAALHRIHGQRIDDLERQVAVLTQRVQLKERPPC